MAGTMSRVAVSSPVGHTLSYSIIGTLVAMEVLSPQNIGITYQKPKETQQAQQQSGGPCFYDTKQFGKYAHDPRDKLYKVSLRRWNSIDLQMGLFNQEVQAEELGCDRQVIWVLKKKRKRKALTENV